MTDQTAPHTSAEILAGFGRLESLQRELADAYSGLGDSLEPSAAARARGAADAWEIAQQILTTAGEVGRAIDDEADELAGELIEARFGVEVYEASLDLHPDAAALTRFLIAGWTGSGADLLAVAEALPHR